MWSCLTCTATDTNYDPHLVRACVFNLGTFALFLLIGEIYGILLFLSSTVIYVPVLLNVSKNIHKYSTVQTIVHTLWPIYYLKHCWKSNELIASKNPSANLRIYTSNYHFANIQCCTVYTHTVYSRVCPFQRRNVTLNKAKWWKPMFSSKKIASNYF